MNAPGFSMGKERGGFWDLKTFERLNKIPQGHEVSWPYLTCTKSKHFLLQTATLVRSRQVVTSLSR